MNKVTKIQVEHTDRKSRLIRVSYQTPEWAQVIERGGGGMLVISTFLAGSALCGVLIKEYADHQFFAQTMLMFCVGSLLSYWLGNTLNHLLQAQRARRGIIKDALRITITPEHFAANGPDVDLMITRVDDMIFTALPHQAGKYEEREERAAQRRIGYSFRDAFEIWLQSGHRFERIASVSDEKCARTIVRHCQEANEHATRGANQQTSFANRTQPV